MIYKKQVMFDIERCICHVPDACRDCSKYKGVDGLRCMEELMADAYVLLKEQEIGHWVVLENCSNAGVYCSECHKKIFDHYPMRKQLSYFCPHCGTRIEGQAVKRK